MVLDGTGSVYDDTGWYKLVLLGTGGTGSTKGLVCLYVLEKVEIWLGVVLMPDTHTQTDNRI